MMIVLRLALAYFREHPSRIVLTSFATAAAAAMVVWVVSGYDAMLGTFDEYSNLALGRYPLSVAPIQHFSQQVPGAIPSPAEKYVPAEVLTALLADPAVAAADPMWAVHENVRPFVEVDGEIIPSARLPDARLLGTDAPQPPFDLIAGKWIDPARPDLLEATMAAEVARGMGLDIGGGVLVGTGDRTLKLKIIGLVDTPAVAGWNASIAGSQLLTPGVGGLFVPMALAEKITGQQARISFVGVSLKPHADVTKFRFAWAPRLNALTTPSQFQEAHDIEEALDETASAENVALQARMATIVAMLAAFFIIFSTLNMGVSERVRQLAILRAVALTRAQTGWLIAIEGLLFGTIGFVAGCMAGKVLMVVAMRAAPDLLEDGAVVGKYSIMLAAACAYGGALLASLVPAIRAMRVRPVDALAPRPAAAKPFVSWRNIAVGLALVTIYPLFAHGMKHADDEPFVLYLVIGIASLTAGFILIAPSVVLLVDRFGSALLARLTGVPSKLLASQLSGNLGRTVATAIALTIGLGLFIGIQVWGHSMLSGFMPGAWAPDALIGFRPHGLPAEEAAKVAGFEGVKQCLPIIVEQPRLKVDLTRSASHASVVRQDNVVMVGIDPFKAFGGDDPLIRFEWVQGGAQEAARLLASGRGCIVPDHFLREARLALGDSFELVPPTAPHHPVRYTIAGAVKMPGWHWQTKPTGMRTRTHRAAALVFAGYGSVAEDFGFRAASHVWIDCHDSHNHSTVLAESARDLYSRALGRPVTIDVARNDEPHVLVRTVGEIRTTVHGHARAWLWVMSRLPLVVLAITSVGVINALLASVQSRRWQMGVLRSMGFTRGMLVRLVITEGILIGMVACVISLAFGILTGWCGTGISSYVSFFGGMELTLVVPWIEIFSGMAAVLVLAALAAVWPAIVIGRAQPLELLQQGRGAF